MTQAGYSESDHGSISDYYKKMEQIENEQGNYADDDSGTQYIFGNLLGAT